MKLYYYDHCPYCTRARMIFALLDIPYDGEILANDDEATPISLIGQKMLPILVKDDGSAMGESLDIVNYIVAQSGCDFDDRIRPELSAILEKIRTNAGSLVVPRTTAIGYEEFATQAAVDYYTAKKTKMVGDFGGQIARSAEYIAKLDDDLNTLDTIILSADAANGIAPSMEDIVLFPVLRGLTTVKGIDWPAGIRAYISSMGRQTGITPLFDRAV